MDDDDVDIGGFMPSSMSGGGTRRQTARPKRYFLTFIICK